MEASAESGTIGQLFLALYEMGFEESQVQAALRAGCFVVQDAAEWILQGGQHRGTLHPQVAAESESPAVSAFNPPLEEGGIHDPQSPGPASPPSPERESNPLPSSRRLLQRREYEERHNASLAREVMEERRTKKQDRDLVLRRIAEDRQIQHNKEQMISPPATSERPGCGDHVISHNHCALMIRLPSGLSVRLGFPADSSLQCVYDHVRSLQPSLSHCSLLQTFPTRHFTEEDLQRSLHELGLTPNATLCVRARDKPKPTPELPLTPQESLPQEPLDIMCNAEDLMLQGDRLLPILSSPAQSISYNVQMREEPTPQHSWGRGHRLSSQEQGGSDGQQRMVSDGYPDAILGQQELLSGSHQWPTNGVRLRSVDQSNDPASPGSASSSPDPPRVMARAAAEMRQGCAEQVPPPKITRMSAVPNLRSLALRRALAVITAPSMQYSGSLSGLTPDLAEMIIDYMIRERALRPKTLDLFTGCPVRRITLNCYQYCTNDLIRQLRGFPGLRTLSLSSCSLITDQGLCVVQQLHKLQHLNLSACRNLTESCLLHLRGLKHLSHLVLDQTKVSDSGMSDFLMSACCPLTQLSFNQTAVTERTLSLLVQQTPNLRVLSVKHTEVSDISSLCGLSQMTTLHLDSTRITEKSLQAIASLPALSTLTLSGVQSLDSNRVLELLSSLSLTRLVLPGRHSLSDEGLAYLSHLRGLSELDLTDHTQITDRGVQYISELTKLRVLSLCNTSVSDCGLLHLRGLKLLEELSLDRTKVTSRGVSHCIPHLPHLQVLGLSDTVVGDNLLKLGLRNCKNLLKVNLSRTRVTNNGLRFLRQVPIVQLSLDGSGVTLQGISDLMTICTTLTSVRANNLRVIPRDQVSDEEDVS
ncbi:uncharacterized protein LOC142159391 [Mixophyes fleayi]|uniref:uncharacterized protein LOC142159391 n=1 Tax=Mixophyes fleayi TaxID=3061075 RepID=UPI003F4DA0FB